MPENKATPPSPDPQAILQDILNYYQNVHALPPGDPAKDVRFYQHIFEKDAVEKAQQVVTFVEGCQPKLKPARIIYCSLGGGNGSEVAYAMHEGGFRRGVLLEYMQEAAKQGERRAGKLRSARRGHLRVLSGDASQGLEDLHRHLLLWRNAATRPTDGLLISAQAVIHELPERSDPRRYHFQKFCALYDNFPIKLYHSREPSRPSPDCGWTEDVQLKVRGLRGEQLANALTLMQNVHGQRIQGPDAAAFHRPIFKVGQDFVQAPGLVAVEFLHKFLRYKNPWNFRHEMQECLVSLNPQKIRDQLASVFGGVQHVTVEPTVSNGFWQAYRAFGVEARRASCVAEPLPVPLCFTVFKAYSHTEVQSDLPPSSETGRARAATRQVSRSAPAPKTLQPKASQKLNQAKARVPVGSARKASPEARGQRSSSAGPKIPIGTAVNKANQSQVIGRVTVKGDMNTTFNTSTRHTHSRRPSMTQVAKNIVNVKSANKQVFNLG